VVKRVALKELLAQAGLAGQEAQAGLAAQEIWQKAQKGVCAQEEQAALLILINHQALSLKGAIILKAPKMEIAAKVLRKKHCATSRLPIPTELTTMINQALKRPNVAARQ
jgi:predicted house-cleaning NTP pyrophosphatase (Maf/HAM1 superfamily)